MIHFHNICSKISLGQQTCTIWGDPHFRGYDIHKQGTIHFQGNCMYLASATKSGALATAFKVCLIYFKLN